MPPAIRWPGIPTISALPRCNGRGPCSMTAATRTATVFWRRCRARGAAITVIPWAVARSIVPMILTRCARLRGSSARRSAPRGGASAMLDLRLYMAQRLSALVMVPLVLGHIAVMIYAIQDGLSTAEILGRTQGSLLWLLFYGSFVIAVSVHAAIGLRVIAHEWGGLRGRMLDALMWGIGACLFYVGILAVFAVCLP